MGVIFVHGYRSEENSQHPGVCPLEEIIEYEIGEKKNEDIIDFFNNYYHEEMSIDWSCDKIVQCIYDKFLIKKGYGIWLATLPAVKELYGKTKIFEYTIPGDKVLGVLSDLAYDGTLYLLKEPVDPECEIVGDEYE